MWFRYKSCSLNWLIICRILINVYRRCHVTSSNRDVCVSSFLPAGRSWRWCTTYWRPSWRWTVPYSMNSQPLTSRTASGEKLFLFTSSLSWIDVTGYDPCRAARHCSGVTIITLHKHQVWYELRWWKQQECLRSAATDPTPEDAWDVELVERVKNLTVNYVNFGDHWLLFRLNMIISPVLYD